MGLVIIGHWQKQTELWVQPVKVASWIPQDHLLTNMSKVLELGFVPRGAAASDVVRRPRSRPSSSMREVMKSVRT